MIKDTGVIDRRSGLWYPCNSWISQMPVWLGEKPKANTSGRPHTLPVPRCLVPSINSA